MPAMGVFRPQWPQVELDIVSGFQADPVGLLAGRADLAIVSEVAVQTGIVYRLAVCFMKWWVSGGADHRWRTRRCGRRRILRMKR